MTATATVFTTGDAPAIGTRVRIEGVTDSGYTFFNGRTGTVTKLTAVLVSRRDGYLTPEARVTVEVDDYPWGFFTVPATLIPLEEP